MRGKKHVSIIIRGQFDQKLLKLAAHNKLGTKAAGFFVSIMNIKIHHCPWTVPKAFCQCSKEI